MDNLRQSIRLATRFLVAMFEDEDYFLTQYHDAWSNSTARFSDPVLVKVLDTGVRIQTSGQSLVWITPDGVIRKAVDFEVADKGPRLGHVLNQQDLESIQRSWFQACFKRLDRTSGYWQQIM